MRKTIAFLKDRSGATAIEYGLIAAGIAVVVVTGVYALGGQLEGTFCAIQQGLDPNAVCPA